MDYSQLSDYGKLKFINGFTNALVQNNITIDVVDKNHITMRWSDGIEIQLDMG
ncbi:hypothetical protein [Weissella viridescens]|uniref:hypothetical protein n=1 Tax=Weissella viridescens TaxID=1629 RepID=UPI0040568103